MNQNQKKKMLNRGLSIALSLLVVAAIGVTVIAIVSARRHTPAETSSSETTEALPQQTTSPTVPIETTSAGDQPIVAEKVVFLSPLTNANIVKEWSADVPVFSDTMEDYRVHLGVDLEADAGTPVYAAADGTVESVVLDPMMGQTVVLAHAAGYRTVYRNLRTEIPEGIVAGASVKAGTQIGAVGDTALVEIAESPHLHFELYAEEKCEDPLSQITVVPFDEGSRYED